MIKNNLKNQDAAAIADKKFGQNFLKDGRVLQQIIQSMPNDDLMVVEIGPGLGDLTKELVRVKNVTAFEVDKRLCEHLQSEFDEYLQKGSFRLNCGDVLERWGERSLVDEPYHLVANLPYYIATNIILKALNDPNCRSVLVMVQKEVAVKFSAEPGQKEFSALGVLAQTAGRGSICFDVPPEAFVPPPKVTSSVLRIIKERTLDDKGFEGFLKAAFSQPRKKLSKNLASSYSKDTINNLFTIEGLDPNIRPHEAATSIYHHLYNELKKDLIDGREQTKQQPAFTAK